MLKFYFNIKHCHFINIDFDKYKRIKSITDHFRELY